MQPRRIPAEIQTRERQLLASALLASLEVRPRKRSRRMRKISSHVERTWVSAGCFGEAVQWRLAKRTQPPEEFEPTDDVLPEPLAQAPEEFDPDEEVE